MISMKDGFSLIKIINLTDALVSVYKSTKVGSSLENKQNLFVNRIFAIQDQPKTLETFQVGKHANLEGCNLINQQKRKVQELFMRHHLSFSQNSHDIGYCDKIKHQIKLNKDAQPIRRSYCCLSFDKKNAMKKNVDDLEDAKLIAPNHSCWAALSILVKKDGSYRLIEYYRGLNKQIEKTSGPLPRTNDVIDYLAGNC